MLFLVSRILGLPAHPLVVHLAVILVPLAAIGYAAFGWRADLRPSLLPALLLLAVIGAAGAILAAQTGGPLEHSVRTAAQQAGAPRPSFGEHPEEGSRAEFGAIVLAISLAGVFAVDLVARAGRRDHRSDGILGSVAAAGARLPAWTPNATYAIALLPAAFALLTMIAAGHSGAALVWRDVGSYAAGG